MGLMAIYEEKRKHRGLKAAPEVKAHPDRPTCNGSPCTEADHSIIIKLSGDKWQSTPYCKATKAPCTHPEHIKSIWYEHTTQPDMDGFKAAFNEYAKKLSANNLYVVDLEDKHPDIYAQTKAAHAQKDTATSLPEYKKALDTLVELYTQTSRRAGQLEITPNAEIARA